MNERMRVGPTPESPRQRQMREQRERQDLEGGKALADYLEAHPAPVTSPENLRECGPEIAEFETMVASFEADHPIAGLSSYIEPTAQGDFLIREPARIALVPIAEKLKTLETQTSIPPERFRELETTYKRLSTAVGFLNNGKIVHDR